MNTYKDFLENKGEKKWQDLWEDQGLFKTPTDATPENKFYILPQLPYPSGSGLHVGHAEVYTACDIYARYQRMIGKKVLQVIGWDSFGLPAENYAIKTNVHPRKSTEDAVNNFRSQIKSLGISVDWDREVGSHNPDYYKWTQWFFLLFYKRGLAYRKKQSVNWCDSCKTVLANDQVKEGHCERCDTLIIQKEMEQWYIKITDYAERLLSDIDKLDWPEETKKRQKDWIGKSEGAIVEFRISNFEFRIDVFTTRPDTLFGATYMVLAPEGKYVQELKDQITNWREVEKYIEITSKKTELDRQVQKEKTGVELKGVKAINPATNEEISIFVADYVLATYGTGAIMAVPAHDERDFEFAKKYRLEIREVVCPVFGLEKDDEIKRKVIKSAIIKDGKVLLVQEDEGWWMLPGGGVQDGESAQQTLAREIREETGYQNIEVKDYLGRMVMHYFNPVNKKNKSKDIECYVVNLLSDSQKIAEKNYKWFELEDAIKVMKESPVQELTQETVYLERFIDGKKKCVATDGISINSDFLDGLETREAKEKMIQWLEENGVGKRKVQYKLRDWSVSRQRFWGAPIPMLFNEQRSTNNKQKFVIIHGLRSSSKNGFKPWLKEELEKQGHTVWSEDLPHADKPNIEEQAQYILDHADVDESVVLIGHSLGGTVIYRLLEKLQNKVSKVIFVDPVVTDKFNDKERSEVTKSCDWKFDWEKIKNKCDEFVILADDNYPIIKKEDLECLRNKVDGVLKMVKPLGPHFSNYEETEIIQESEVLTACEVSSLKPVPESDLPVLLPDDVDFKPTGQSPLTYSEDFQKGVEKKYGKGWKREPDTLDTFMCSSWYYYRYLDPKNDTAFASPEALKKWMPVDFYLGGPEHVNGHLLYARFFTKVLYDAGYIDFDEPFKVHRHQGLILGPDNRKMSKRWGNVINPTDVVNEFGADTMRMYEMFMGPLEEDKPWDENGVKGIRRFLEKVWNLQEKVIEAEAKNNSLTTLVHQTIKKVGEDVESLKFNTAIAMLMQFVNVLLKEEKISKTGYSVLIKLLSPFASHMAEELWHKLGNKDTVATQPWPVYDPGLIKEDTITLAIQINGKLRDTIIVSSDISEEDAKAEALKSEKIQKWLEGKEPTKVIYVKGKLISIVV
ncbi:MAG: alpha/beta fold hydrolase [Candidatus Magasanikbacteria bacterium]